MLRLVPPAGTPVRLSQVLRALKCACTLDGRSEAGLDALRKQTKARYVFALSSGRAALWAILKVLHRLKPNRNVVAIPAYTCFSVPASIVRAGLRLHPVDIDPETLDFDFAQLSSLPGQDLLCILTAHLFGFVNDVTRTRQIAKANGAFLVDDAAQALGASREGHWAGNSGDAGLYSLSRGKTLPCVEGGLIVTDSEEIASALRAEAATLPPARSLHRASVLFQMLAYSLFMNPRLYWMPNSMPFLKLGVTEFDPDFRISSFTRLSEALFTVLMEDLSEINEVRRRNARVIAMGLSGNSNFGMPMPAADCQPVYLRFPVIARDTALRDRAVQELQGAGIGAGTFYPSAVCDIPGIDGCMAMADCHCPRAEDLARRLLTLPVHPYVSDRDLHRMIAVLNDLRSVQSRPEA